MNLANLLRALAIALALALTGIESGAASTVTYFHNDLSGTPQLETDANGNVVWKESYQPYGGRSVNATPSVDNKIWFHGKPYDETSGLSYFGARYYDPVLARFTGMDPAPQDPLNLCSSNRYCYGNDNPYKYVDPDGRNPDFVWGAGVGTVYSKADAQLVADAEASVGNRAARAGISVGRAGKVLAAGGALPDAAIESADVFRLKLPMFGGLGNGPKNTSDETNWLYQKLDKDGNHLKYGVTNDLKGRYTVEELAGGRLKPLASGTKAEMHNLERGLHENLPIGPEERQEYYRRLQASKGYTNPPAPREQRK